MARLTPISDVPEARPLDLVSAHLAHGAAAYEAAGDIAATGLITSATLRDGLRIVTCGFRLDTSVAGRVLMPPGLSVVLVLEGQGRLNLSRSVVAGDCLVALSAVPVWRTMSAAAGDIFRFVGISAPAAWLDLYGAPLPQAPFDRHQRMPARVAALAASLNRAAQPAPAARLLQEAAALETLGHLLPGTVMPADGAAVPRLSAREHRALAQLRDIIEAEFSTELRLVDLARRIGVSLTRMKEIHRQVHGQPIAASIAETRLQHATALLRGGQRHVAEVAYAVGYTPTHFATAYRRRFGVAPGRVARGAE